MVTINNPAQEGPQPAAEPDLGHEQLEYDNERLRRNYKAAIKVYSSLINLRFPPERQTNKEIGTLVAAFCRAHDYSKKDADDLAMAASWYNIGKLAWPDALIAVALEDMTRDQREQYREYPTTGQRLLLAIDPALDATELIRHHQERWDGGGIPDGLMGPAIPPGSRLLKIVVDFVELQMGMVLQRRFTREDALTEIAKYAARSYDPILSQQFIDMVVALGDDDAPADGVTQRLKTHALESDMIVMQKLHTAGGMLLLNEGTVLTERLIEKLQAFEENEGSQYVLYVTKPEIET
ncbi:MAG TPA: HD domain-containing phosphohydrolase [Candidimonas sp.]|nr:HD domain-containing phosphohydrolase [Candidimonas sp.]